MPLKIPPSTSNIAFINFNAPVSFWLWLMGISQAGALTRQETAEAAQLYKAGDGYLTGYLPGITSQASCQPY